MASSTKNLTFKSSDNITMSIPEAVAKRSRTIKHLIEDLSSTDDVIPLPDVSGHILDIVFHYCSKHVDFETDSKSTNLDIENLKIWDAEFFKVDEDILFKLIQAAKYLDIPDLLHRTAQTIAHRMKGMTTEEMRTMFNIENDFTPEEEEAVRKDNEWIIETLSEEMDAKIRKLEKGRHQLYP